MAKAWVGVAAGIVLPLAAGVLVAAPVAAGIANFTDCKFPQGQLKKLLNPGPGNNNAEFVVFSANTNAGGGNGGEEASPAAGCTTGLAVDDKAANDNAKDDDLFATDPGNSAKNDQTLP